MRDFAFYNAGVDDAKGPRRVFGLARRLLRRLQRPMLYRQEAIYRDLQAQLDQLSGQLRALGDRTATSDAFGWDYVAMARRLAAIEDHLAASCPDAAEVDRYAPNLGPGRRADAAEADGIPAPRSSSRPGGSPAGSEADGASRFRHS